MVKEKKEPKEQRSIQLPKSVWKNIEAKAQEEKRSVNTTIEWAFINYLKNNPIEAL